MKSCRQFVMLWEKKLSLNSFFRRVCMSFGISLQCDRMMILSSREYIYISKMITIRLFKIILTD